MQYLCTHFIFCLPHHLFQCSNSIEFYFSIHHHHHKTDESNWNEWWKSAFCPCTWSNFYLLTIFTCSSVQETLTFADSTLSNALFDDNQNPQSTLSQTGVVDEIFLTLDNAFSEELNNNNEWNIDRNDIKNWDSCETDVARTTNMVNFNCYFAIQ
jgi:hypothetical protein